MTSDSHLQPEADGHRYLQVLSLKLLQMLCQRCGPTKPASAAETVSSRTGAHVFTVPHETSRSGGEGCFLGCAVGYACNSSHMLSHFHIFFLAMPLLQEGEVDAAISAK